MELPNILYTDNDFNNYYLKVFFILNNKNIIVNIKYFMFFYK